MRKLTGALSLLSALLLAACGGGASLGDGGGGNTLGGTTGGGTTGGTTPSGVVAKVTLIPSVDQVVADGASTVLLAATVEDTTGSPVAGKTLTFVSNVGTLSAATATTNTDGQAQVYLKSSSKSGAATVTAAEVDSGVSAITTVSFVAGPAKTLALAMTPANVVPGQQATLVATLTDAYNNAVEDATIGFTLTMNASGASLSDVQGTTDLNGQARLTYTAGSTLGTDIISANTGNGVSSTLTVVVSATGLTGNLVLSTGSDSVAAGYPSGVTLSATVTDTSGRPMAGKTVTFNVTDGTLPNGGMTDTALTDSDGVARLKLAPPTHTTPVLTVRAEADGFVDERSLAVVPGPADAGKSSIIANPGTMLADGVSETAITVIENDRFNNALPDGTLITVQTTAGTLKSNTAELISGRATFTLTAPTIAGTATVTVPAVSGLSAVVTFTGASTGDPASLRFSATETQIYVAGVGQTQQSTIKVTVLDSAGNPIDESKYGNPSLNNLQAKFITRPNGGETLSGVAANGTVTASAAAGAVAIRTTDGVATVTLSSGTISGVVQVQFSVLKFTGGSFTNPADVAASGALPQVSIAAGPPASMTFSGPITNAVEIIKAPNGSNSGNYGLHGKVDVRDRYGNFVPDGTVVNFALMDSVIVQDNTGTTAMGSPNLGRSGSSLINRRCTTQPGGTPNAPTEASGCNVLGSNTALSDFTSTITRNGISRGIQNGDLILIRDTDSQDKKRTVLSVTGQTQVVANANYSQVASNAMFWTGSALSGGAISGYAADGTTLTPGTGIVENGYAPFRVDYPANTGSILLGCYGYGSGGRYNDVDKRDAVPQSRQVVVSADAGTVSAIDAGDFCFKAVAGGTLTPASAALSLSNGQSQTVSMDLRDGGDTVFLPYMPISCFQSAASVQSVLNYVVTATIATNTDGLSSTDVTGRTAVTFAATGAAEGISGDSVTYTCTGADASTDITISHP